jgi:RNA polymerase sigma factor (sigma-70 family)
MGSVRTETLLRHLRGLAAVHGPAVPADRELVQRFAARADEDAFAALLSRHGPMVLRVCRRVLHHLQDAEDAFQATFLVLARKASTLRRQESVGNWLYGVAYRVALNSRAAAARRRAHESRTAPDAPADPLTEISVREAQALLDEELARLPAKYRAPLVLCCLEGLARDEAARQLDWPVGTLKSRLERGRQLLRCRLTRRGLTLPAAFGAALLGRDLAQAELPAALARATLQGALGCVARTAAASAVPSPPALALADEMVRALAAARLRFGVALLLAAGLLAVGLVAGQATSPQPLKPQPLAAGTLARSDAGKAQSARKDRYGDPLPEEAIARLGTTRLRHGAAIFSLRFIPDGKTLVAQGQDGVRLWNAATGEQRHFFPLESRNVSGANAALSPDGAHVAMPGKSGVHIWDVDTGKLLRTIGTGQCVRPCFSPDGKTLVAQILEVENRVKLWDTATGKELACWKGEDARATMGHLFMSDGKSLVTWDEMRIALIRVCEPGIGKEIWSAKAVPNGTRGVALSPDGILLAAVLSPPVDFRKGEYFGRSRAPEGCIRLWDAASGRELRELLVTARENKSRPTQYFGALAFAPDGKTLYAGGIDDTLIAWDPGTGKELRRVGRDLSHPLALAVSPDNRTLAAVSTSMTIRLLDLASGKDRFPEAGRQSQINHAAITPDGQVAVTVDSRHIHVWDPATGREVRRLALEPGRLLNRIQLTDDGRTLIFSDIAEWLKQHIKLRAWDLTSGKELRRLDWEGQKGGRLLDLAPDGKALACSRPGGVTLMDWTTGQELGKLPGDTYGVQGAAFTADGRRLVLWEHSRLTRLWDLAAGREIRRFSLPEGNEKRPLPYRATVSPDGRYLAYSSQSRFIALYDLSTGEEIRKWPASWAQTLAFSPDGKTLAWGGYQEPAILFMEVATGRERHRLKGHRGGVSALGFSADGKTLISASYDSTALVWDLTGRLQAKAASVKPLTAAELNACWAALAGADAARAYQALRRLAACPAAAVPYLQARLRPAPAADEKKVARLIRDLTSDRFAERDRAAKELEKLGEAAAGACRKALAAAPPLELRRRLEALLKAQRQAWWAPAPDRLRALRALEALERVGTAEARQLLSRLARGAPEARLTLEAQASLERLQRHTTARPGAEPR